MPEPTRRGQRRWPAASAWVEGRRSLMIYGGFVRRCPTDVAHVL